MIIDDKIIDGNLQYDISNVVSKIFELSSGKIDQYKYLAHLEILPLQHHRRKYKRLNLLILRLRRHRKNKQKRLTSMVKNKFRY